MDLRIQDVAVHFGKVEALRGVSLALSPGRTTVLVGPNGAGKSTLMGVLLGLTRPDRGTVLANGHEVASPRRAATREFRARTGYLPEAPAFSDNLSGRQVLRFFASARGTAKAAVDTALERVGLTAAADRAVGGYSRGMRQRLGLGVAILASPDLLILDEPTGGLDQQGLAVLWSVLDEWREAGRTVLLSTHEVALIERRADDLCILRQGVVQASGTPDALRRAAGLPVRVHLSTPGSAAAQALAERLAPHGEISLAERGVGLIVAPDRLLRLMATLQGVELDGLRVEEPGLDEVTQQILGGAPWDASAVH